MFQGCAYRRRTGACTCDNPPIGCVRDAPLQGGGLSFPTGVTSYRALRELQQGRSAVAPVVRQQDMPRRPPQHLRASLGLLHAAPLLSLPSVGWNCTGAAVRSCTTQLPPLLFVDGCACAADVLSALAERSSPRPVVCAVVASSEEAASLQPLSCGTQLLLLLRVCDTPSLEQDWASCGCHGVAVDDSAADPSLPARLLARLLATGRPLAAMALPMRPGLAQRAAVGAARRGGVRLLALRADAGTGGAARDRVAWAVARDTVAIVADAAHADVAAGLELDEAAKAALDAL